jgi:hypothetical protein
VSVVIASAASDTVVSATPDAVDAILEDICEYDNTLKALFNTSISFIRCIYA